MNGERYSRQTQLKDFGREAQTRLASAKVLVVGAGGLGVPVLMYLNAMGVGTLGIVEEDEVSLSNLHRQVLYSAVEVGHAKLDVAIKRLKAQNPDTHLIPYYEFLTLENALSIIEGYDLVIDATDNFPTRYLINDACVILKKPFVYGALHGFEGQVSVFNYKNGPTYRCLFPKMPTAKEVPNCNEHGVLGVIPAIVGNLQALEAVKVLTGIGEVLSGKLLLFNGLDQSFRKIKFDKIPSNLVIETLQETYGFDCRTDSDSVEVAEFEKLLSDESIQIIDVRTVGEFEDFHLKNSVNLPLDKIEDWKHKLDYDRAVYVLCHSGSRSLEAQSILVSYKNGAKVINVNGGIEQLKKYAVKY
ncbi:HesA/MoeB/ThiF family protein [Maribacter sp. TH_r10]|uniref:HesA/MoeB/ThiF family protein n=1 Tax=Maribacter sp. TH_r10 TaxID=3082086 RepID=UPI002954E346|nr:HesA/MoeB/ThiF family protein [Maribacter sp. TH_r10]MDV7140759.1 HesA/MoeB/ThiF family protein [Maribacter sp. TH_r10]